METQPGSGGQRLVCPGCGKTVKVPGGTASGTPSAAEPDGESSGSQRPGIANIPIICPFCRSRMYASRAQVGKTMVCPDCLETVAVEVAGEDPLAEPEEQPPEEQPPDEQPPSEQPPASNRPADEER